LVLPCPFLYDRRKSNFNLYIYAFEALGVATWHASRRIGTSLATAIERPFLLVIDGLRHERKSGERRAK
jgi:hypothetical protein